MSIDVSSAHTRTDDSRLRTWLDDALPPGIDRPAFALAAIGLAVMYAPAVDDLARNVWSRDEQGHGPIIVAVALWLAFRRRRLIAASEVKPALAWGLPIFLMALLIFVVGRSQAMLTLEVGSLLPLLVSLVLMLRGTQALKACWFPLFFLCFMVPLPVTLVAMLTTPLKSAVSAVASDWLYSLGYPVGRSGVILTVGQYQLLVADACAGLNSMFTLEALGLLYLNLMNHKSAARNAFLALMVVPIAFLANVIRVMLLVLVTFHFGDEAGQGFVHGFAGMVLFMVALGLIFATDHALTVGQRFVAARAP